MDSPAASVTREVVTQVQCSGQVPSHASHTSHATMEVNLGEGAELRLKV